MKTKKIIIAVVVALLAIAALVFFLWPKELEPSSDAFTNTVRALESDAGWGVTGYELDLEKGTAEVTVSLQMKENRGADQPDCFTFYLIANQDINIDQASLSAQLVKADEKTKDISGGALETLMISESWSGKIDADTYYWQKGAPAALAAGTAKRYDVIALDLSDTGYGRWVLKMTITGITGSDFNACFGIQPINKDLPQTFAFVSAANTTTGYTFTEANRWIVLPEPVLAGAVSAAN